MIRSHCALQYPYVYGILQRFLQLSPPPSYIFIVSDAREVIDQLNVVFEMAKENLDDAQLQWRPVRNSTYE